MESALTYHSAQALLAWQIELGATEAILDAPINRYDAPAKIAPISKPQIQTATPAGQETAPKDDIDPVALARDMAQNARDLPALKQALATFDLCDLKRGARSLVFADGDPAADIMIIAEAPGRDEDRIGKPFVGRAGQLLDRMLAAIDLSREAQTSEASVYITNILPWRPPQNRDPKPEEIAMMMPFVQRHVELAKPDLVILMGNIACQGVLGKRGITRLRGTWAEAFGRPCLPMFHPAFLLRNPQMKREAWADLLEIKARRIT